MKIRKLALELRGATKRESLAAGAKSLLATHIPCQQSKLDIPIVSVGERLTKQDFSNGNQPRSTFENG
jgi:hypothetical protein